MEVLFSRWRYRDFFSDYLPFQFFSVISSIVFLINFAGLLDYTIVSETVKHVSAILEYVDTNRQAIIDSRLEENKFYCFDFTVLCQNDGIKAKWPQFKEDLVEKPDHTLGCLGFGLYQVIIIWIIYLLN